MCLCLVVFDSLRDTFHRTRTPPYYVIVGIWRDGSVLKSICCSCKDPVLLSAPTWELIPFCNSSYRVSGPPWDRVIHEGKTLIRIDKKLIFVQGQVGWLVDAWERSCEGWHCQRQVQMLTASCLKDGRCLDLTGRRKQGGERKGKF